MQINNNIVLIHLKGTCKANLRSEYKIKLKTIPREVTTARNRHLHSNNASPNISLRYILEPVKSQEHKCLDSFLVVINTDYQADELKYKCLMAVVLIIKQARFFNQVTNPQLQNKIGG